MIYLWRGLGGIWHIGDESDFAADMLLKLVLLSLAIAIFVLALVVLIPYEVVSRLVGRVAPGPPAVASGAAAGVATLLLAGALLGSRGYATTGTTSYGYSQATFGTTSSAAIGPAATPPAATLSVPGADPNADLPAPSRTLSAGDAITLDGVRISVSIPLGACQGYPFALNVENPTSSEATLFYRFAQPMWGGQPVSGCYSGQVLGGVVHAAPGKTVVGFQDWEDGPTLMDLSVGGETWVLYSLDHQAPGGSAASLGMGDSATRDGVRLTVVPASQATPADSPCSGYAFSLRVANSGEAQANVNYGFSGANDVWGGVAPRAGCYPGPATTGTVSIGVGKTTILGFRDANADPTVLTVVVGKTAPVTWNLPH